MLPLPKSISICLLTGDPVQARKQKESLKEVESKYNVEWYLRSDRIPYVQYSSWSQVVNEGVVSTDSEFIFLFNHRIIPTFEDIENIMEDLRAGFSLSCITSMGGFGIMREVFRMVGLLDERFYGGEYEDEDFILRLRQHNLGIKWSFDLERYSPFMRDGSNYLYGTGKSLYDIKWFIEDNVAYRTDLFINEKLLPPHQLYKNNLEVQKNFKKWSESYCEDNWHIFENANNITVSDKLANSLSSKENLTVAFKGLDEGGLFELHLHTSTPLTIYIGFFESSLSTPKSLLPYGYGFRKFPIAKSPKFIWWKNEFNVEAFDVRVFHQGKLLLRDAEHKVEDIKTYNLTVNHYTFEV